LRIKKLAIKPLDRLSEDMKFLEEMILNYPRSAEGKIDYTKDEGRPPTSINLLNFKIKMEKEIRRTCRKIENKIGFEMPDGFK